METALRYAEQHSDKMAIVTTTADARKVIASGRMAVFLGNELGWDHEGDLDVLGAFYRLGLRTVQFASQTGFNAMADSDISMQQGGQKPDHFHGLSEQGRAVAAEMNRLGILIDITHGTDDAAEAAHRRRARCRWSAATPRSRRCRAPACRTRSLKLLASKGGVVGIHGGAAVVGKRYRKWVAEHPNEMKEAAKGLPNMLGYEPSQPRKAGDHGEYIAMFDKEFGGAWRAREAGRSCPRSSR